MRTQN